MPRYYFDVDDGDTVTVDHFGDELADLYEAREQAQALLPDLAREKMPDGDRRVLKVVVRCSGGRCRYEARLTLDAEWIEPPTYPPRTGETILEHGAASQSAPPVRQG